MICEFCYTSHFYRKLSDRENDVHRMFFLGRNFVSGVISTFKSKKP